MRYNLGLIRLLDTTVMIQLGQIHSLYECSRVAVGIEQGSTALDVELDPFLFKSCRFITTNNAHCKVGN